MREQGYKIGGLRVRTYRPFPTEDIIEYIKNVDVLGVVDRAAAFGNITGSPLATDVMAACQRYSATQGMKIIPFVGGLGGRDVTEEQQIDQIKILFELKEKGEFPDRKYRMWGTYWSGLITGDKEPPNKDELYFGDI
jgi:pyruvate ferredoxin oxidoreductase alpha subunit